MTTEAAIKRCEPEAEVTLAERTRDRRAYRPNVDIIEQSDELLVLADVPGVKPDDVDIQYEQGLLTIHGKVGPRQDEPNTNWLLGEYGVGDFYRTFKIGEGIDAAKIRAELKNGVLELHLSKAEAAKPRKIVVTTE